MAQSTHNIQIKFNVKSQELKRAEAELRKINKEIARIQAGPVTGTTSKQLSGLQAQSAIETSRVQSLKNQQKEYNKELKETQKIAKSTNAALEKQSNLAAGLTATGKKDDRRSSLGSRTSRALGQSFLEAPLYSASFALMAGIGTSIAQFVQLDKTLTRIAIVTERSSQSMQAFARYANDAGKALGVTGQRFAEASLIFLQQGGLAADYSDSLAESSIKLANITGTQAEDTSEYITAIANSFKLLETDGVKAGARIVDMLSALDAASGSSADEIANAFKKSASSFAAAGFSAEEAASMIAVVSETTRQAPELIGTGMKTLIGNLSEMKVGSTEFVGITNKLQDITKKFGISFSLIDKNTKNVKTLPKLFKDLAVIYKRTGDEAAKRAIIEAVAGKEQRDRFIALITNQERYNELLYIANNSAGAADRAQSLYLESITGKLERLKNEFEELVLNVIGTDSFKSLIDALTNILANFNQLNKEGGAFFSILLKIVSVLATIGLLKGLGTKRGLLSSGDKAITGATGTAPATTRMGKIGEGVKGIGGLNIAAAGTMLTIGGFQAAKIGGQEDLTSGEKAGGIAASLAPGIGAIAGGIAGSFIPVVGTFLGASLGTLAGQAAAAGIGLVSLNKGAIAARDELNRLSSAAVETLSTREGRQQVSDLFDIVTSSGIDTTTERYKVAADQLGAIMPGLVARQDEYGNSILRSKEEMQGYIDTQNKLVNLEKVLAAPDIISGVLDLIKVQEDKKEEAVTTSFKSLMTGLFLSGGKLGVGADLGKQIEISKGDFSDKEQLSIDEANLRISSLREVYVKNVEAFFSELIMASDKFTESQSINMQEAFAKIMTDGGKGIKGKLLEGYTKINEAIKSGLSGEKLFTELSKLLSDSQFADALTAYGKQLQDAEIYLTDLYSDTKNFGMSKEDVIEQFKVRFPSLSEEDFKTLGGDAYYKYVAETIDDTENLITDAQRKIKFTEVLQEILGLEDVSGIVDTIFTGSDDLSQAMDYLGVELRNAINQLKADILNAADTGGKITFEEFKTLQAQAQAVGGNIVGKAYGISSGAGLTEIPINQADSNSIITNLQVVMNQSKVAETTLERAKRKLDESLAEFDEKLKRIIDKYALLFSNLSVEREKLLAAQNDSIEYSADWEKMQLDVLKFSEEELRLNKAKRAELQALLKDVPASIEYDGKRHDLLLLINEQHLAEIRNLEQIQKQREDYLSSPFLNSIRENEKAIRDLNNANTEYDITLGKITKDSKEYQEVLGQKISGTEKEISLLEQNIATQRKLLDVEGIGAQKKQESAIIAKALDIELLSRQEDLRIQQEELFSSPYLFAIEKSNEALEDQSYALSITDKSNEDYLNTSKDLIKAQTTLYTDKLKYIAALEKESYLSGEQKIILEDLKDEVSSLSETIKRSAIDLALDEFNSAIFGTADIDELKKKYEINLKYYDDLIDAHEQIIERGRIELDIQQEIESSTDEAYKTNLKYLKTKLQDTKLTTQQINATRSQIDLLKSLSSSLSTTQNQFKLTRSPSGGFRFAPEASATTEQSKAQALEAAVGFEQKSIGEYRRIADEEFSAIQEAAMYETMAGGATEGSVQQTEYSERAKTLRSYIKSLEGQRQAQGKEIERAKVVSSLVQSGQLKLASRVTSGQISAQEALKSLSPERRAGILESIEQSKISILSPEVVATNKLTFTIENLIKALDNLKITVKENTDISRTLGKGVATPGSAVEMANDARLANDPAFVKSEITRTNEVIAYRNSVGLLTIAQEKYLEKLESMISKEGFTSNSSSLKNEKETEKLSNSINPGGLYNQYLGAPRMESGGYTGNSSGLAVLHEKEIVLNKLDTSRILEAVRLVRNMPNMINSPISENSKQSSSNNQNVTINAEFPNVTSADQIKAAFASMSSRALQYAYSKKSY